MDTALAMALREGGVPYQARRRGCFAERDFACVVSGVMRGAAPRRAKSGAPYCHCCDYCGALWGSSDFDVVVFPVAGMFRFAVGASGPCGGGAGASCLARLRGDLGRAALFIASGEKARLLLATRSAALA